MASTATTTSSTTSTTGHSGTSYEGPTGALAPNVYADLTMTRAASGAVKVYLANTPQIAFTDALGGSMIGSDGLRFFTDDGSEEEAGSLARLRVFNGVLDAGADRDRPGDGWIRGRSSGDGQAGAGAEEAKEGEEGFAGSDRHLPVRGRPLP